jgi:hypothetical protein
MENRALLQYLIDTSDVVLAKKQEATEYLAGVMDENTALRAAVGRLEGERDVLRGALFLAANEAYKSEVVQTEMESLTVGDGKEYEDRYDWIKQRREYWISEAAAALAADERGTG